MTTPAAAFPRGLAVLLGAAAAVIVAAGLQAAAWLVGPVFLALVIVIAVHPALGALRRRGVPSWAATAALVLIVYSVLLVLAGVVIASVARLATILPQYAGQAAELVGSLTGVLATVGVGPVQLAELAASLSFGKVLGLVGALLLGITSLLSNLVFLLSLLLFLSIEASGAGSRLARIAQDRPEIAAALGRFAWGTRRFLAVTTIFGLVTAVVDTVALLLLGVPLAVLWGLLAFITNYVPYVGFVIGVVPPALLGLLEGGWRLFAIVLVIYTVANFVLNSLVQPRFTGDAVGLSVTVILLALVFWGWLLGPLGAVLAIPLTLLTKALLVDVDPRAGWADALLGSTTAPRPAPAGADPPAAATPAPAAAEPVPVEEGIR
ncbi:MAG: AI-2E family transporter [Pseudonocardia sp.]